MIFNMKFCRCLLLLCLGVALQAQTEMQMNVQQLVDFVRSEVALRQHTDKQIAAYIKKIQLTEKLTDKTITDLVAQGARPKTEQALQELRDQTANMKPPPRDATYSPATAPDQTLSSAPPTAGISSAAAPIPAPDSVKQQQILDLMRQYAMSYEQNLPNYICVRVDRRYVDPNAGDSYRSLGTVLSRVSYNEGQEKYKVYSVAGKLVDTDMNGVTGGARSQGEFAGLMRSIFEEKSEAEFGWDHWGSCAAGSWPFSTTSSTAGTPATPLNMVILRATNSASSPPTGGSSTPIRIQARSTASNLRQSIFREASPSRRPLKLLIMIW